MRDGERLATSSQRTILAATNQEHVYYRLSVRWLRIYVLKGDDRRKRRAAAAQQKKKRKKRRRKGERRRRKGGG